MAFVIYNRADWGARPPRRPPTRLTTPVAEVWVHHDASFFKSAWWAYRSREKERMRIIQDYSMNKRGYNDFPYNFAIFPSGRVYEGRGWATLGAHNDGDNISTGVVFIGNFQGQQPTDAALKSHRALLWRGVKNGNIKNGTIIRGHKDSDATACPGTLLYARMKSLTPSPWPIG